MRLAHAERTKQKNVFLAFQESEAGQFTQLAFVDRKLEGEVGLVHALVIGEERPLESSAARSSSAWPGFRLSRSA